MAVNQTRANDRLLAVTNGSVALAKGLEVIGLGPVHCHFPLPLSFLPCVVHNVGLRKLQWTCKWLHLALRL